MCVQRLRAHQCGVRVMCGYAVCICATSDVNAAGRSLPSFIEMLRINSCFNLYEYLKDLFFGGFTPSDFICLIKGSLCPTVCICPLWYVQENPKFIAYWYFSFNCIQV